MIRPWNTLFLIATALFITSSHAIAQPAPVAIGKNGDVELTQPTRVGTMTLEPGHYRLQHQMQDGAHFLVIKRRAERQTGSMHEATGPGEEVARVACEVVALNAKVKETSLYLRREPDGTSVITQIRIRGERGGHVIALEPKAS